MILKFGKNDGYDWFYCVKENQHAAAYHPLYFSIFLSLQAYFLLQISQLLWEPESSNFVYTLRVAKYIVGQKTKLLRFILPSFSFFPFLTPCNTQTGKFVSIISQELLHLGFCNLVQMLWMICCITWKRTWLLLLILPFNIFIFLSVQFSDIKKIISLFSGTEKVETWSTKLKLGPVHKVETWSTHGQ